MAAPLPFSPPSLSSTLLPLPAANETPHTSSPSPFQNLKPSILVILLILSITFLLSISLCFLLRHLNRRFLRNLSSADVTVIASSAANRHSANRISPEVDPVCSLIDSLPVFAYSSIKRRSAASSADCAVCLSKFEPQDLLRLLPLCCHAFHLSCIDTWLQSNQTCPLCRSPIHASESDILKAISSAIEGGNGDSFRLEIGSVSRRQTPPDSTAAAAADVRSYSFGSFDYIVDEESEVNTRQTQTHSHRRSLSDKEIEAQVTQLAADLNLAAEIGGGRSWLKEYVDRLSVSLSSRAVSFRSSGRFFTGSSRRSDIGAAGDYDLEADRAGEEISEMFRWFSGV